MPRIQTQRATPRIPFTLKRDATIEGKAEGRRNPRGALQQVPPAGFMRDQRDYLFFARDDLALIYRRRAAKGRWRFLQPLSASPSYVPVVERHRERGSER